jgi:hypothetical protein
MRRDRRFLLLFVTFVIGALVCGPARSAQEGAKLEGHWEGAVIYSPATLEVDFSIDLSRDGKGIWTGTMDIPVLGVESVPLQELSVNGSRLAFTYRDPQRARTFSGGLAETGDLIQGDSVEGKSTASFELRRVARREARSRPAIHSLSQDGRELATLFNQDQQDVRLLIIVAPTCERCRVGTRMVQRYVLDQIPDPDLRVYVVWLARHKDDTQEAAQKATALLPDPRVTHFWIDNPSVSDLFKPSLGLTEGTVWDVFLSFAPGLRWMEQPPAPTSYMHMLYEVLPKERQLDGQQLQESLKALLGTLNRKPA